MNTYANIQQMLTRLLSTQDIVGRQQYYCYQDKICFAYTLKSPVWNLSGKNSDITPDKESGGSGQNSDLTPDK